MHNIKRTNTENICRKKENYYGDIRRLSAVYYSVSQQLSITDGHTARQHVDVCELAFLSSRSGPHSVSTTNRPPNKFA